MKLIKKLINIFPFFYIQLILICKNRLGVILVFISILCKYLLKKYIRVVNLLFFAQ